MAIDIAAWVKAHKMAVYGGGAGLVLAVGYSVLKRGSGRAQTQQMPVDPAQYLIPNSLLNAPAGGLVFGGGDGLVPSSPVTPTQPPLTPSTPSTTPVPSQAPAPVQSWFDPGPQQAPAPLPTAPHPSVPDPIQFVREYTFDDPNLVHPVQVQEYYRPPGNSSTLPPPPAGVGRTVTTQYGSIGYIPSAAMKKTSTGINIPPGSVDKGSYWLTPTGRQLVK